MTDDNHHHGADNERRTLLAMLLTGGFMVVEAVGGVMSGSLALLADAGHMLADTAALALAWTAFRVGRRPPDPRRSYGYHRFQVLAALVNGVTLIVIVGWILIEAVRRLMAPGEVIGTMMLAVAGAGLVVNVVAFLVLHGGDRENLNIRGALLHVVGDLMGSAAAIVAAGVILLTGWVPIDPLLSVLVAALIVRSAWVLVRRSAHILLEGTPEWLDVERLRAELTEAVPEVEDIHHVHVWSLTARRTLLTLHARVRDGADHARSLAGIKDFLEQRHGISHSTVQIEPGSCADRPPPG